MLGCCVELLGKQASMHEEQLSFTQPSPHFFEFEFDCHRRQRRRGRVGYASQGMAVSFASVDALMICLVLLALLFLSFWLEHARISWITESGAAMLCGMVMGLAIVTFGTRKDVDADGFNDDLFFYGLLPPIILDAGFSMKKQKFLSNITTILSLAVLGTLVSTFVTGAILHKLGILPPAESYVFGALISATDPVSTLSVFKKVGAPELLFNLVFGESVLNDAVAIVLYEIFLKIANTNPTPKEFTLAMAAGAGRDLVYIGVASLLVAVACSLPAAYLMRQPYLRGLRTMPALEMGIVLLVSYAGYILATILNLSGIITLFFSGLFVQHYHMHNLSRPGRVAVTHTLHMLAMLFENFIFVYLGISLFAYSNKFEWDPLFLVLIIPILCLSRAVHVYPLLAVANLGRRKAVPRSYFLPIWFAGLRGAIAFALALSYKGRHEKRIQAATFFVIIFTTLVFGNATGPLLRRLQLLKPRKRMRIAGGQQQHGNNSSDEDGSDDDEDGEGGALLDGSGGGGGRASRGGSDEEGGAAGEQAAEMTLKEALAAGISPWRWLCHVGPCRPAPGMRGMHGRWKRFDDSVMQPLFGRAEAEPAGSGAEEGSGPGRAGGQGRGGAAAGGGGGGAGLKCEVEPMSPATEMLALSPPVARRNLRPRSKSEGQTESHQDGTQPPPPPPPPDIAGSATPVKVVNVVVGVAALALAGGGTLESAAAGDA